MLNRSAMKEVLDIALPAVGEATIYTLMSVLDIMMIGNYGGNKAVSAVGISNDILYTCVNVFISVGVCIGITSFVSRCIGAKNKEDAEQYASIGFVFGTFISVITCYTLFIFSKDILSIAGARGEVLTLSNNFTKTIILAIFFNMMVNILSSILRGYGNTYIPFYTSLIICSIKILLDWILIFGIVTAELGVKGSAVASIISQAIGFIFLFFYIVKWSKVKIRIKHMIIINRKKIKNLISLSIPSSMEEAAFSISKLICIFIIMRSGTVAFAANQIANTVESISFMPGMGFGIAATTLVGIKFGEKNYKGAKEYTYACTIGAVAMMSFFSVVFLIMPGILVNLFVGKEEKTVMQLAAVCLFIGAFEQPSIAISSVFEGALKGVGDTKTPLIISILTSWFIRLPLTFYFIYIMKFSIVYVWIITAIQWAVDALLMLISLNKKLKYRFR